ncbi:MAG: phenylalanine--tRNA ligase subunit beta [Saprospiraceae bacterium]
MKLALNWLKEYTDINLPPQKVGEILTDIGLEVEGEEEIESIPGGLAGLVVGHVKECGKHPNADKLSLTKVDVGGVELLQIVCGAPNVAAGQKVVVATVGTTIHPLAGDPFKIKKGKIRGEVSMGMLCAEDEIGLGTDHNGIIVLPEDLAVGTLVKDHYELENDYVYEIGLTPNRSDGTNQTGSAKDLAAALKINYGHSGEVRMPSVADFKVDNHDLPIQVTVENTVACPRYSGVSISGVTIKESPDWLKARLQSIGVRPISNVVDITNFVLHELGQPLHAFDADKITGKTIIVKNLAKGTTFLSLDEVERKLIDTDLMICDGESNGLCIAGVFGGIKSGVTDGTTNIFLESAHFNAKTTRKTSFHHDLRTDAAKVFEKGSDPNITVYALKRAAQLIKELAGGEIASEIVDIYPTEIKRAEIKVAYRNVERLIGVHIPKAEIRAILEAMEMEILEDGEESFVVAVPTNKADVTREADLIEEILRIYGFNKVPIPTQVKNSVVATKRPSPQELRNVVGDYLSANGFNEMMAVSLTKSSYSREILPIPEAALVFVNNTSNITLDVMRPTMLFSGLEAIAHNQNRRSIDLKLFESGKTYKKTEEGGHKETQHLSLFLTGQKASENWQKTGQIPADFYTLKAYVNNVLARLGVKGFQEDNLKDDVFSMGYKYFRGQQIVAKFGKVQKKIAKAMGIKSEVYYADINFDALIKATKKHKIGYEELNKFPTVRRDLALVIDNAVSFNDIVRLARKTNKKSLKDINLFDVYTNEDQLGAGKKSYAVSFIFEDKTKTLVDKFVDKEMNKLIQIFERNLNAQIRR